MQIRVALPPGVQPGQVIQVRAPSGAIVQVRAPPGVPPGGTFVVSVPDAQPPTVQSYAAPKPVQPRPAPTPSRLQAPTPYRAPPQQQYRPRLYSTGAIYTRNQNPTCADGGWWKWICCRGSQNYCAYTPCCCCCCTDQVYAVEQSTVGIVESFGKFQYVAQP